MSNAQLKCIKTITYNDNTDRERERARVVNNPHSIIQNDHVAYKSSKLVFISKRFSLIIVLVPKGAVIVDVGIL